MVDGFGNNTTVECFMDMNYLEYDDRCIVSFSATS